MEIYIEYLLIDNLIINALIIFLTSKLLQLKLKFKRILLVSIVATCFAFVFPYIMILLNSWLIVAIKLIIGFFITLIMKKQKFGRLIITYIVFLTITMLFGGVCFGLIMMLGLKTTLNGILMFGFEFPMGLIVLVLAFYCYVLCKLINYLKNKNINNGLNYDVIVQINNKSYSLVGYFDTGNMVYDNNMKKPVLIVSFEFYKKIIENFNIKNTMKQIFIDEFRNPHFINVETVSSKDKIFAFEIDSLKIYANKKIYKNENVIVGVSKTKFTDFDCILHKDFLNYGVNF